MSNNYSIDLKQGPSLLYVIPIKPVVLAVQLGAILFQFKSIYDFEYNFVGDLVFRIFVIFLSLTSFTAFLFNQKILMKAHLVMAIFLLAGPIACLQYLVFDFYRAEFHGDNNLKWDHTSSFENYLIFILVILLAVALGSYTWLCHLLIEGLDEKNAPKRRPQCKICSNHYVVPENEKLIYNIA